MRQASRKNNKIFNCIFDAAVQLLYPNRCLGCDEKLDIEGACFCSDCEKKIIRVNGNYCLKCGKHLRDETKEYCYDCNRKKHRFIAGRTAFVYTGAMKHAMYLFKYSNRRYYAKAFANEWLRQHARWLKSINPDAIVPVPMYKCKERKRGYNQATVLAKELSRATGIPVYTKLIKRTRDTIPMKKLVSEVDRKRNLFNAFKIKENGVKFNRILLVDDIYTTGATFDHVAEALLTCANEIYCMSVCAGSDRKRLD